MVNYSRLNSEIDAAAARAAEIRNGAYFCARIAELAELFKPECADAKERSALRARLSESLRKRGGRSGQATAAGRHIARVLNAK